MLTRHEHHGVVWIDLERPTREDARAVMAEFKLDPLVAEELLMPSVKARVDRHPEHLYLILHFPALRHTHTTKEQEVDFVIGNKFIITARYDTIDPLHKFAKIFDVNSVLDKEILGDSAGVILYYMLKRLYGAVEHEIDFVSDELQVIEANIFRGRERAMVESISKSGRDLLNLRQVVEPHRDILHTLEEHAPQIFGAEFTPYMRSLLNEYYRVHNHIMRQTENLRELRETNNSLVQTKQNEVIQRLSAGALITFPLALIVAMLDMHLPGNPLEEFPHAFIGVFLLVAAGAGLLGYYFGKKGWL